MKKGIRKKIRDIIGNTDGIMTMDERISILVYKERKKAKLEGIQIGRDEMYNELNLEHQFDEKSINN